MLPASTAQSHTQRMRVAIAQARLGIAAGQSPFGSAIFDDSTGALIAAAHNCVWAATDPTAHAEVNAIRAATHSRSAIVLSGCVLYSTCEPCPMCMAAIHWAKLDHVYYGASIRDAAAAGFSELFLPARTLIELGRSSVGIDAGLLEDECRELFAAWRAHGGEAY